MTINGKKYQTPFIETLIFAVIPDVSTQLSALRTAKVDWCKDVDRTYVDTLAETTPELLRFPRAAGGLTGIDFQCETSQYFDDVNVRRAMMIGTDRNAMAAKLYGAGNYDLAPMGKGYSLSVPILDLPASTKELFTYDAVKAKQMLTDAGFPNGAKS